MKISLLMAVLFFSASALADTSVKVFGSVKDYAAFIKANPKVKVVAVTPITSSQDFCPTASGYYCYSSYTSSVLVTYEN